MKLIDEFSISDTIKLKLQTGEYKDKERVDLRQYVLKNNEYIPTPKGVSINMEWVDRFIEMLGKLKKEV